MSLTRSLRSLVVAAALAAPLATVACSDGDRPPPVSTPTAAAPTAAPSLSPAPTVEPVTTLLFTGDIIPARCVYAEIQERGGDWTLPFQPLQAVLSAADLTIGTLDATVSNAGVPIGCTETFNLAGPAAVAGGLAFAGYDVISHAANHIKDCGNANCGDQAMFETADILHGAGISVVGTGSNVTEARRPVVVERNGVRFAFLAYDDIAAYYQATAGTAGSAPLDASTT